MFLATTMLTAGSKRRTFMLEIYWREVRLENLRPLIL